MIDTSLFLDAKRLFTTFVIGHQNCDASKATEAIAQRLAIALARQQESQRIRCKERCAIRDGAALQSTNRPSERRKKRDETPYRLGKLRVDVALGAELRE